MCTVSLIKTASGTRLVSNRDEKRTRPRALPPTLVSFAGVQACMPIDPQGGGSWIGMSSAGLIITLLNQTSNHQADAVHAQRTGPSLHSRGEIVRQCLAMHTLADVQRYLASVRASSFGPMLVIATDSHTVLEARTLGDRLDLHHSVLSLARVWSSSSLGDALVVQPRERLFAELVESSPTFAAQDAFHAHSWPDRPWQSVKMAREDARTVSTTACQFLSPSQASLTYADFWLPSSPLNTQHSLPVTANASASSSASSPAHATTLQKS